MNDYYVVAVSHIDMGFVMREEAQEELLEILLERVTGVLERNPEIHFALEQAAHYRKLEKRRPDLLEKVKKLLAEGRMEFMGGMATSAETNFPDGECLIRNQGMGLLWVEQHLGVSPTEGWLVDTFGLNAQVPQIMKQFGYQHLYANRFGGDKRYDLFWDEGLDKSRVLVIGKDSGSINVLPDSQELIFCRNWNDVDTLFERADELKGSTPRLVHYYIENEEIFSEYYLKLTAERKKRGSWKHATYHEYSQALEESGYEAPVLFGDLNPEFTGTFALRTPIRVANRAAEIMLLNAEIWDSLLKEPDNKTRTELENCWWDIFYNQFHDVFSGSHEDRTYQRVMENYDRIRTCSREVQEQALQLTAAGKNSMVCCNDLPWRRKEWIELQQESGQKSYFLAEVPAGGLKQYEIDPKDVKKEKHEEHRREITNGILRLVLDEREGIQSLEDTEGNRYMQNAADFLVAQADRGGLQIERCEGEEIYAMTGDVHIGDVFHSEMGERITMYGEFPVMNWNEQKNQLAWEAEFTLRREERALRLRLTVDWNGQETRIRLRVPANMESRDVYYEIPFGVTRRETYRNRPTARGEWPAHRFVALENGTRGIALINRGVAGVEQEGAALTTTLIRAYGDCDDPWIAPTELTSQNGKQTFEFMIAPYEGDYKTAGIVSLAQEFNQPLQCIMGKRIPKDEEGTWFEIDKKNIVLSTIKRAWDGSNELVVRFYETEGTETTANIRIRGAEQVYNSDMKEVKKEELPHNGTSFSIVLKPFEIRTVRIKRQEN